MRLQQLKLDDVAQTNVAQHFLVPVFVNGALTFISQSAAQIHAGGLRSLRINSVTPTVPSSGSIAAASRKILNERGGKCCRARRFCRSRRLLELPSPMALPTQPADLASTHGSTLSAGFGSFALAEGANVRTACSLTSISSTQEHLYLSL